MPDHVSLAFTPSGQACVAYWYRPGSYPDLVYTIRFAREAIRAPWTVQDIAQVGSPTGPVAAVSPQNVVCVAFCDSDTGELKLATKASGAAWQIETVDGSESNPAIPYPAISLAPDGSPVLAYAINSFDSASLRLARKVGGQWRREPVATLGRTQSYHCSVCVNSLGMPFVAYQDPATTSLKSAWKKTVVTGFPKPWMMPPRAGSGHR